MIIWVETGGFHCIEEYKIKYMATQNEEIKAVYQSIIKDLEEIIDDYKEFTVPF